MRKDNNMDFFINSLNPQTPNKHFQVKGQQVLKLLI
jgi:hypothetical protein